MPIEDSKTYTIEEFASEIGRSVSWVMEHLVLPSDPRSHKMLVDEYGNPVLGCPAKQFGTLKLINGKAYNSWLRSKSASLPRQRREDAETKDD